LTGAETKVFETSFRWIHSRKEHDLESAEFRKEWNFLAATSAAETVYAKFPDDKEKVEERENRMKASRRSKLRRQGRISPRAVW
jgi:hypothetical protein